jgi:hypothetical protein
MKSVCRYAIDHLVRILFFAIPLLAMILVSVNHVFGQTNPGAQALPFSLSSHSDAINLPAGVAMHDFNSNPTSRLLTPGTGNMGATNTQGGWSAEGVNGIGMKGSNGSTRRAGAMVVAVNTTGLSNIQVAWTVRIIQQNASIDNAVALQYRVGTSGNYIDVGGAASEYLSAGKAVSHAQTFSFQLPSGANNQAVVQVRFMYWDTNTNNGDRDLLSVDDVSICTSVVPSLTINASSTTICAGSLVSYTASPVNGGSNPSYQWKLNGSNVGSNSDTYNNNAHNDGDQVSCVLTSSNACASPGTANSNTITINVASTVIPSITIVANANPSCAGDDVTFSAFPVNGGSTPFYLWKVNGINSGTNSNVFIASGLTNGNQVSCTLTSNASCALPATANSNIIDMVVNPTVIPSVSIASDINPICAGSSPNFTASVVNGGSSPAYQWRINGNPVGTNSDSYSISNMTGGDAVSCVLTSNATCASPIVVFSNLLSSQKVLLPYIENFTASDCWSIVHVSGSPAGDWSYETSMTDPSLSPVSGARFAYFNAKGFDTGTRSRLISPRIDLTTTTDPVFIVSYSKDNGAPAAADRIEIKVSTNDGVTWSPALRSPERYGVNFNNPGWTLANVELSPFQASSQVRIAIEGVSEAGNNIAVDFVKIEEMTGCGVPKNRFSNNVTTASANVHWQVVSGNSNYRVRYSEFLTPTDFSFINTGNISNATIQNLKPSTTYLWWVSSTCSGLTYGYQAYPDTITTPPGTSPCTKPFNLVHNIVGPTIVRLSCSQLVTGHEFKIRYTETGGVPNYKYKTVTGPNGINNTFNDTLTGLVPNTTYTWSLNTFCSGIGSGWSPDETFNTPAAVSYLSCVRPFNTYATNITSGSGLIGWDTLVISDVFKLRYAPVSSPAAFKYKTVNGGTPGNNNITILIDDLLPSTSYNYSVQSICIGKKSIYSENNVLVTGSLRTTGFIADSKSEVAFFPNPVKEKITLRVKNDGLAYFSEFILRDITGRTVMIKPIVIEKGLNEFVMELNGITHGIYFAEITGFGRRIEKIFVE